VMELIQSMGDADVNAEVLAGKISHDQALAAKTLRLANSSFYGLSRQVTSIAEATTILGLRTVRSIAMAAGLVGGFSDAACRSFNFSAFWRHAIGSGLCARSLAQALRLDDDAAFTLGLMHDIGQLVLVSRYPELYAAALDYQREHDCVVSEAERFAFGTDHAAVGALVVERWHFAPSVVAAIAAHHDPQMNAAKSLADIVHVADNMAHALDLSHREDDMVPPLSVAAWSRLALTESICAQVFGATESQHESVCQALLS
jgi:putative nucleotidyltransferase with HDIG domain